MAAKSLIKPVKQDAEFLQDVLRARADQGPLHLWWFGQSGFLLQWAGQHLLFDPYLSDSLTRKYAGTNKPHVRMTARVVGPERMDFIEVVTSSHNHTDHLDAETLVPLLHANPSLHLVIPCHFDMFEFNTVTPAEFTDACQALCQPHRVLLCGERWSSAELER
jgi:L-ascorbate metabolism protein UlaG (beta-lactamase superfamily)